jgi:CYTH domain-containing protein
MVQIEHERKFQVVGREWGRSVLEKYRIKQGYLIDENGVEVRVRVLKDKAVLTCKIKSGEDISKRIEIEESISLDLGLELYERCHNKLEKTRFMVEDRNLLWEVDEYLLELEGVVTAEIENPPNDLVLPVWIGRELTGVDGWSNASLAKNGRPDQDK